MKVTYRQLVDLTQGINRLTTKDVSVAGMLQIIKLNDEIDAAMKTLHPKYNASLKALMAEYGIESVDGGYNWEGHEKAAEISAAVSSLGDSLDTELAETNKVDEVDVFAMTTGMTVGEVKAFRHYLRKD